MEINENLANNPLADEQFRCVRIYDTEDGMANVELNILSNGKVLTLKTSQVKAVRFKLRHTYVLSFKEI